MNNKQDSMCYIPELIPKLGRIAKFGLALNTFFFIVITSMAQGYYSWYTDFTREDFSENSSNVISGIIIDTAYKSNIWQTGKPVKAKFNESYLSPRALMTDTANFYPPDNNSTFMIKIVPPVGFFWGGMGIMFTHRIDTDTLFSGGYIEISYNGGNKWINIVEDKSFDARTISHSMYKVNDTILGAIPAFTGNSDNYDKEMLWHNWIMSWYSWTWADKFNPKPDLFDSILIQFTFRSSNALVSKEGWIISNMSVDFIDCFTGIENSTVIQNKPVVKLLENKELFISHFGNNIENYTINVLTVTGVKVLSMNKTCHDSITIPLHNLTTGIYIYQIANSKDIFTSGKFIIY